MAHSLIRSGVAAWLIGCAPAPPASVVATGPTPVCQAMRERRAEAKLVLAAGRPRRADSLLQCADKRCPSEAASSADLRKKIAEALGRNLKADLGEALATSTDPELAVDMLGRLGAGPPTRRAVRVAPGTGIALSNGRVVLDGAREGDAREVLVYEPKAWTARFAVPAKSWQLSPDGLVLATLDDKEVRFHDPLTGASAAFPAGELTYSPDSQRAAIVSDAGVAIVGLVKRTLDQTIAAKGRPTVRFAGKVLLLTTEAGALDVVELGTGKTLLSRKDVLDVALDENEKRLAWAASVDGAVDLAFVDLATFATVKTARAAFPVTANRLRVAIADDGRFVALSDGKTLVVMDGKSGAVRKLPTRPGGDFGVTELYLDREGRRVCGVFAREGETCAWDLPTNAVITTAPFVSRRRAVEVKTKGLGAPSARVVPNVIAGAARVQNGALAPDDRTFAVVEQDGKRLYLVLYDLTKKKVLARLPLDGEPVEYVSLLRVAFVADVFFVRVGARAWIVDPRTRAVLASLDDTDGVPVALGDTLVLAAPRGGVVTLDRKTGAARSLTLNQAADVCAVGPHLLPPKACEEPLDCP